MAERRAEEGKINTCQQRENGRQLPLVGTSIDYCILHIRRSEGHLKKLLQLCHGPAKVSHFTHILSSSSIDKHMMRPKLTVMQTFASFPYKLKK